jgi:ribose transport system ATP-binding protein
MGNLLQMKGVSKTFGPTKALDNVTFELNSNECHALMGENGAGKSTLIKILMGVYTKDAGTIIIRGKEVGIASPHAAARQGIAAVYQDVFLAPQLSIGENFFLGGLPVTGTGRVDWKKVYREADTNLEKLHIELNSREKLSSLTIAQQQMVAIAKAVYQNAQILIFDEPTALLTNDEKRQIFDIIRRMRDMGHGIIYISHRMEEVFEICDRVTVLKDGKYVDTRNLRETDENALVSLMVGRDLSNMYNIETHAKNNVVLEVRDFSAKAKNVSGVSFDLRENEVLGIFGLIGSGRSELLRAVFGVDKKTEGLVKLFGKEIHLKNPRQSIVNRVGMIAEDRKYQSLALNLPVVDNINLPSYPDISALGVFISRSQARKNTALYVDKLNIKTPNLQQSAGNLSGGNQQKVVIAKWLLTGARILVADEPTIGVDVGSRNEIYKLMENLTGSGVSIILISSYLPEVMGLSDRIMVMHEGKTMGILDKKDFTEENLMTLASGLELKLGS